MATNTYVALDRVTATAAANVSFTSIPATYTDLILVAVAKSSVTGSSVNNYRIRFNNDTTSVYSNTAIRGDGSTATSVRDSNQNEMYLAFLSQVSAQAETSIFHVMNYSNTTTNKTVLARGGSSSGGFVGAAVGLWRKTDAIDRLDIYGPSGETVTGTFSLYGIKAEPAWSAKATGGTITNDVSYTYHTFTSTGTFTPTQALSCDYLVVAGGGGGGRGAYGEGGGGGAGGLRSTVGLTGGGGALESALSVTAQAYTIQVGAGGSGGTGAGSSGASGTDSIFSTVTSIGGGGGAAAANDANRLGKTGGSGGGGGGTTGVSGTGGSGTANQGYAGGNSPAGNPGSGGGGGGGAGAIGATGGDNNSGAGGNGGAGVATAISGTSTTYAGGGGGSSEAGSGGSGGSGGGGAGGSGSGGNGANGTVNRGGGGGSGFNSQGTGGSGIVIIRYAN